MTAFTIFARNYSLERLAEYSKKFDIQESGCWIWNGRVINSGYGVFGATKLAHRIMWELMGNGIDHKKVIDHLCCNKLCVNPTHLEEVSVQENSDRYYRNYYANKSKEIL